MYSTKNENVLEESPCFLDLDTSLWMCKDQMKSINISQVCNGYKDCNDESDESYHMCSIDYPYLEVFIYLCLIIVGMLIYGAWEICISSNLSYK